MWLCYSLFRNLLEEILEDVYFWKLLENIIDLPNYSTHSPRFGTRKFLDKKSQSPWLIELSLLILHRRRRFYISLYSEKTLYFSKGYWYSYQHKSKDAINFSRHAAEWKSQIMHILDHFQLSQLQWTYSLHWCGSWYHSTVNICCTTEQIRIQTIMKFPKHAFIDKHHKIRLQLTHACRMVISSQM